MRLGKRIFSIFLCLALVLSGMVIPIKEVQAEEVQVEEIQAEEVQVETEDCHHRKECKQNRFQSLLWL